MTTDLIIEEADEIPPIRREETSSKYEPVLEHARKIAPKSAVVKTDSREKATSIASYLRRLVDEDDYNVEQRLTDVYVLFNG